MTVTEREENLGLYEIRYNKNGSCDGGLSARKCRNQIKK
jgi:hypothetical protein